MTNSMIQARKARLLRRNSAWVHWSPDGSTWFNDGKGTFRDLGRIAFGNAKIFATEKGAMLRVRL